MATVYRGEHVSGIGMTAAIKKLHPHLAIDSNLRRRLRVEAKALVRLNHPNIVRILDFVEEDEACALVVELVEGRTLRAVMSDYADRPMPLALALLLFRQMLVAVGHAHKHDCLHRDIKPGNVMVSDDNHVKVLDFGIASLVDQERLTQTGISIGTPVYMAPEAITNGMDALDERADIYALGVTFWEVLAGKGARPIGQQGWRLETDAVEALANVGVPEGVVDVIKKMLAFDPDQRLASCQAALRALGWAMEESKDGGRASVSGVRAPLPAGPGTPAPPLVGKDDETAVRDVPFQSAMRRGADAPPPRALPAGPSPGGGAEDGKKARDRPKKKRRKKPRQAAAAGRRARNRKTTRTRKTSRHLVVGGIAAVLVIGAALAGALRGPSLGGVQGTPEAMAALSRLPGMVAFDRSAFHYGPEDRKVVLSAFALERTEVTVESYGRCVATGACPDRIGEYVGRKPTGTSPMEHVDWMQAQTYCEWRYRNAPVPKGYASRLPTDAEWERAARGTGRPGRAFPMGDDLPMDLASAATSSPPPTGTTPADVTPEGVADLAASVSEWVFDEGPAGGPEDSVRYDYPSDAASDPVSVPASRSTGTRGVRGSSYLQHPSQSHYFASKGRTWNTSSRSGSGRGFRCAVATRVRAGS